MSEDADVLIALTERQEQVLEYIYDCVRDGMPPTKAEIAAKLDLWPSSVADILRALAKKERITLIPNVSRGIKLL
jgi:Mn-dependent DtxR family transcriptional regulator